MDLITTINAASQDSSVLRVAVRAHASSSVLPNCFNELFSTALTMRDAGKVTHFAMCHSDIIAPPGWLDALYAEMWSHGLDAVSAVVPIKGPTGRTSTAVGSESDRWRVNRCVYLKDRATLPATFTARDVCRPGAGEVLLINTGLMLLDLRRPWWDDFAFQFHSRIKRTTRGDGATAYVCEARSEDWEMSHHLHEAGAKYGATWRVRLRHEGLNRWPNYDDPAPPPGVEPYWRSVDGWLTAEEGDALQRLAAGGVCLEMGSYKGRSTCCLAEVADRVVAVDWHEGDAGAGKGGTLETLKANLAAGSIKNVEVAHGRIADVTPHLPSDWYDLVFVDDSHDEATVLSAREAARLVKPGGVVAFHDWPIPAVQAAARAAGLEPTDFAGSLAWCRVAKKAGG